MELSSAYKMLNNILNKNSFVNIEMNNLDEPRAFNTRLIYGVLEKNITLNYYIKSLCEKNPKPSISVLLKIGLYMLLYMSEPEYAVINSVVDTAKKAGKGGTAGFINAVLRKYKDVKLPSGDSVFALSVRYGYPEFAVKKLIEDYGKEIAVAEMVFDEPSLTHIRHNSKLITKEKFWELLPNNGQINASCHGYYVTHTTLDALNSYEELYTIQGLSSMLVCNSFTKVCNMRILDLCAAPGGKSIYMSELYDAEVIATDVHAHRVELIESYARRMRADTVKAIVADGTIFNTEFQDAFDAVLCDVPCSGFGVVKSKPDILFKKQENTDSLRELQLKLLENAGKYVKKGGELVYSTCTLFKDENVEVVRSFLEKNKKFKLVDNPLPLMPKFKLEELNAHQFFTSQDKTDGFFIAKLSKSL